MTRPYQNLEILRLRDQYLSNDDGLADNFFSLIEKLAVFVKVLKIENCHILRQDLVSLMLPFTQLRECSFSNLLLSDDFLHEEIEDTVSCQNLKTLRLGQCDFFCLLLFKSYDKLESLVILDPAYNRTDVELLEDFLLQQTKLKELVLKEFRFNSTYSTDRLARVPFQLEKLSLYGTYWDIPDHYALFVKSQTKLKCLELAGFRCIHPYADNHIWFSSVMKHFFTRNPDLTSLKIDTKYSAMPLIKDEEFLPGVFNNKLQHLTFFRDTGDKSEFFKIFKRIFPKVQSLTYIDFSLDSSLSLENLQHFKHLESLKLKITPKSLTNLRLGSKLLSFKYSAINEDKSSEKLTEFFVQNSTIKNVSLNIEPLTVEEITEMVLSLSSSLESLSISDLHLNPTEAELLSENFKSLKTIRSDFPINSEIIPILKTSNIRFKIERAEFLFEGD